MRQVTQPAHSLIGIELTPYQATQALAAIAIFNRVLKFPNKTGAEIMRGFEKDCGYSLIEFFEDIEQLSGIIGEPLLICKFGSGEEIDPRLLPINDDEFGESAEVIQLRPGETLQVEPS